MDAKSFAIKCHSLAQKTLRKMSVLVDDILLRTTNVKIITEKIVKIYSDETKKFFVGYKDKYIGFIGVDYEIKNINNIQKENVKYAKKYIRIGVKSIMGVDDNDNVLVVELKKKKLLNRINLIFHMSIYHLINTTNHILNLIHKIPKETVIFPFNNKSSHWMSRFLSNKHKSTKENFKFKSKKDNSVVWEYKNGYYSGSLFPCHFWCKLIIMPSF